jgi:hypothetical protein
MATTLIEWRPSTLFAACSPEVSAQLVSTMAQAMGRPVAATVVRVESVYGLVPTAAVLPGADSFGAMKINNYIGTPAAALGAAAAGAAMSNLAMAFGDIRKQQLGDDTAQGTDARGIPPRGRRSA